jgi:FkbM family methyltransferase
MCDAAAGQYLVDLGVWQLGTAGVNSEHLPYRSIYSRRDRLKDLLRPMLEFFRIGTLSRPSLNQLDEKLERLLPRHGGWFVEAGAYDGFQQSNTYYFAKLKGWRGVLIEPLPQLASRCRQRRQEAIVISCVLGAPEDVGRTVRLRHAGLMTMVCGTMADAATEHVRAEAGLRVQGLPPLEQFVEAPVRTLTDVLEESGTPSDFDLLSLDVEGSEVAALRGLDLKRFLPRAICVEIRHENLAVVQHLLEERYEQPLFLTHHASYSDCFFALKNQTASAAA